MKNLKLLIIALFLVSASIIYAQTADEIISNYFENTGGLTAWNSLEGMKMDAKINQMGMEIPLEIISLKDGRQMTIINFQGKIIKQGVFDGNVLWGVNFMTQKAEKSDQETTENMKIQARDFPDPFLNYKDKGYKVELLANEAIDGTDCFKIKLTKDQLTVDGNKEDNVSFYFFDTESFVPLAVHSEIKMGPMKGQISETKMSEYQEIDGIYFPFSLSQGLKGQPGQIISILKISLNPQIDAKEFAFPEEVETPQVPQ
ncbi:MAG: outer membrane lipoprotein-sorting protein [Bacteroidota bacterium]|jgi:outer membrane lipoprotein-sorting protein